MKRGKIKIHGSREWRWMKRNIEKQVGGYKRMSKIQLKQRGLEAVKTEVREDRERRNK